MALSQLIAEAEIQTPHKWFRRGHDIVLSASCSQFLSINPFNCKRNSHNLCVFLYFATISGQLCRESIISQVLCSSVYPFHLIRHSSFVNFDDTLIMSCLRILCTTNSCSPFSTTGIGGDLGDFPSIYGLNKDT